MMKSNSTVRKNLMKDPNYSPYCGDPDCKPRNSFPKLNERWPRTNFTSGQFKCPKCGWQSKFPDDFINAYKQQHNLK